LGFSVKTIIDIGTLLVQSIVDVGAFLVQPLIDGIASLIQPILDCLTGAICQGGGCGDCDQQAEHS
jgi:hypothetical protein